MDKNTVLDQRMNYIDLRSDTVTWPTLEMRTAMANAAVGDDVFGDDPTVTELETVAAKMFGKEAGLFVTSGTQGNLLAVMCHCSMGEEAIMGDVSHTFLYEVGGVSAVAGVLPHCVPVQSDGTLKLEDIQNAIRPHDDHHPKTTLVIIENTQNRKGGLPLPPSYMNAVGDLAKKNNLKYHVDGARIFNAAISCGVEVKDLVASADSITFCLSKGLGAPAGSVLLGSKEFIKMARKKRKMLGGGLRQVGILAAAGLVALRNTPPLLALDHSRAKYLGGVLKNIDGLKVLSVYTNFIWFEITDPKITPEAFEEYLWDRFRIKLGAYSGRLFRCSLHFWVGDKEIEKIIIAIKEIMSQGKSKL